MRLLVKNVTKARLKRTQLQILTNELEDTACRLSDSRSRMHQIETEH